jgi:hypothetical protein
MLVVDYRKLYLRMFNAVTDAEQLVSRVARVMHATKIEY